MFKKIEDHAVKRKNGFCLKREADFCNMIFFYGKNQEETILTDVKALIRTMEREYGIRLTAGIGKRTDSLSDLKFAYKTAAFACNLYYFKQDPVIIYDRINKEYHHSFDDYNEAYSALVKAILLRDDMWLDQLKQCLELIGELHYGNRVVAENRCVALLMELLRELGNYCRLDEEDRHTYEGFVSGIRSVGTFQKVKAMILRYLEQFVEKTVFSNLGNENETIRGIKFYIRENYDQEINLRSLSQHFFMNQYYFSSFFKQKTGKNFKDYLVEVRMQKALELLLENSGMSTQELARKVGYNDAKSFSEKFRQYYGESPVNYKKINKM
ncbi:MAG: AraC family transcriptional regulator [Clostridium sp.]|nr:AraC family transcriptional regulator [Clostridium sp.]